MKLEDLDTSKCLFDPKRSDILTVAQSYSEFSVELSYRLSVRMVLRYIALLYDAMSPLWREVRSLPLRKAVAMELAGAKRDRTGKFERPVEMIFEGKNQTVNAMIIKYIVLQNSPTWSKLVAYENLYYMELAKIQNGAYGKTNDIITAIDKLSVAITNLTEEILCGHGEAVPILDAIYKEATKDLDVSPEKISTYIEESGNVPEDWSPYNSWKDNEINETYTVDEIRFIGSN